MNIPEYLNVPLLTILGAVSVFLLRSLSRIDRRLLSIEQHLFEKGAKIHQGNGGLFLAMICLGSVCMVGCVADPILKEEQFITHTVEIPEVTTIVTNETGGVTTVVTPAQTVTRVDTNIVASVNPSWTTAIDTVKGLNGAFNPTPAAPIVNLILGGLAAGLAWYARIKNKKAGLVDVLIDGVERANNPEVKKVIKDVSALWGKSTQLHSEVNKQTK